ncbi:MAG: hypothetical protein J6T26_01955 [Firmicutes bacterium]|nr:hypothetical protein [Bacillota bacterium]
MNSPSPNRRYSAPRPAPAFRAASPVQGRPLQNETPMENDMTQPGAMPSAPGAPGIAAAPAAVVPPIPPLPLLPVPYDYNAEGLTMRDLLLECLGHYIIAEHQLGLSGLTTKEGRLVRVESNAYVLVEESSGNSLVCDYYSLKFFRCLGEVPQ